MKATSNSLHYQRKFLNVNCDKRKNLDVFFKNFNLRIFNHENAPRVLVFVAQMSSSFLFRKNEHSSKWGRMAKHLYLMLRISELVKIHNWTGDALKRNGNWKLLVRFVWAVNLFSSEVDVGIYFRAKWTSEEFSKLH